MREIRAVPTPHKSPVCCPIWLAGFPPNNGTAALQARAANVQPGKWRPGVSQAGALPGAGGHPPSLFQHFLPRGTHLCPHSFHLDALPPSFLLPSASSHSKDLHERPSWGTLGSSCNQKAHSQRKATTTSPPGMPPSEFLSRGFCQSANILAQEVRPN